MKNHYNTLGLNEGASQEEIQEAYDRLKKELDPTINNNQDFFIEEFEKLQEAYKALRNTSILSTTISKEKVPTFEFSNLSSKVLDDNNKKSKLKDFILQNKKRLVVGLVIISISSLFWLTLFNNNYKSSEITIIDGIAYTKKDMFPLNGYVNDDGEYKNGLAEGKHEKYDKKGNLIATGFYNKGKKNGLWQEWYSIKDGKFHFWIEKGLQKTVSNYKNGILEGEYQSWFENGQLEKKGYYKNDKYKGNWYYYDEKGNLLAHFNCDYSIWAERNLDVTRYRNGDLIPEVQDPIEWSKLTTGAWCYYNNDPENGKKYGKLYNEYAKNDPRGLAPIGYHIPSNYEFFISSEIESDGCEWYYRNFDGEFFWADFFVLDHDLDKRNKMGSNIICLKN
ncbi:MAG: hypothetical protein RIQ59_196 [Bacteroidota bacterium]|jgi:antitoxin component YwqK of YwqJK toxin-antitoxin module